MADGHFISQVLGLGRFTDKAKTGTKNPASPTPIPNLPAFLPPARKSPPKPTPIPDIVGGSPAGPRSNRSTLIGGDAPAVRKTMLGT